jgi:hypothetical protein
MGKHARNAVDGDNLVASPVSCLIRGRRPNNVSRLIVAVGVYSFKAVLRRRPLPDVSKKRLEAINPRGVDGNPSTPVLGIRLISRGKAPSNHVRPRAVFGRDSLLSCGVTMFAVNHLRNFSSAFYALRAFSLSKVSRGHEVFVPARTAAFPHCGTINYTVIRGHGPLSEAFSG